MDQGIAPEVRPRFGRYLMGTDAQNSIAHVFVRESAADGIDVGGAFIDLEHSTIAHSSVAKIAKSDRRESPVFPYCAQPHLFTLKRRGV